MAASKIILETKKLSKSFGSIQANQQISLQIRQGEILAILGENGSGKTTFMNLLAGIYQPDSGQIYLAGQQVQINSPKKALELGIGMVQQQSRLVESLTGEENLALGLKVKPAQIKEQAQKICRQYNFELPWSQPVARLSLVQKQVLEIIRLIHRQAQILILDEPSAILGKAEKLKLRQALQKLQDEGKTILIITHDAREASQIANRIAFFKQGELIEISENPPVFAEHLPAGNLPLGHSKQYLKIEKLSWSNYASLSLQAWGGEILGLTGSIYSRQLLEILAGLKTDYNGSIKFATKSRIWELSQKNSVQIRKSGLQLRYIPPDRSCSGLIFSSGIQPNMQLRTFQHPKAGQMAKKLAARILQPLKIQLDRPDLPIGFLSGGNQQKILLGREVFSQPDILLADCPTRGLDFKALEIWLNLLNRLKAQKTVIIWTDEEEQLLQKYSDRLLRLEGAG